MTKITEIYADRLVPLLKLNLGKLGKPVPSDANLRLIAIGLIEKAEEKKVALTSSALSYIAFLYANVYAAGPVEFLSPSPWIAPELQVYTDMQDWMLVDPIHEVAEEGWPIRPTDEK